MSERAPSVQFTATSIGDLVIFVASVEIGIDGKGATIMDASKMRYEVLFPVLVKLSP
jgi:hypothetical protein